jgi:hypothetical protein
VISPVILADVAAGCPIRRGDYAQRLRCHRVLDRLLKFLKRLLGR